MTQRANKFLWNIHTALCGGRKPGSDEDKRFLALALCGEAAELAETGLPLEVAREELGDCYAYFILLTIAFGFDVSGLPQLNSPVLPIRVAIACGELANLVKKEWRGDLIENYRGQVADHLGHISIALHGCASMLGTSLDLILANTILPKIQKRWGNEVKT
jgi:hypothetical protein